MATLQDIESKAATYANARQALADVVASLEDETVALKKKYLPRIKRWVETTKAKEAELHAAIKESPALFIKPRTQIMHGIKVGYRKANGKIEFEDDEQVVKLIRKHFPEQFDMLVKTTEKPIKKGLEQLSATDLKKLGITVEETGDVVLIKDVTTDVDKLVTALLKEDTEEAEA